MCYLPFSRGLKKYLSSINHFESVAREKIVIPKPENAPILIPLIIISKVFPIGLTEL